MELKQTKVRLRDGTIGDCVLQVSTSFPWQIVLSGIESKTFNASGSDLFKALWSLREQLELLGMTLLIKGAKKDVVCSGMSRTMGGGRKAYVVRLGEPARQEEIVDILDDITDGELVVSTEEQQDFYKQWVKSLHERIND